MAPSPLPFRRALPLLMTVVALGALALFLALNHRYIAAHYSLHPRTVLLIALIIPVTLALRGEANRQLFGSMGVGAPWRDWFRLVTVSAFINYLPFSAGLAAKAFFVNKVYGMPYRSFALTQAKLFILFMSTNGFLGLAVLAVKFPDHIIGAVGAAFALMSGSAVLLFLPERILRRLGGARLAAAGERSAQPGRTWVKVVLCQLVIQLAAAAALKLSFDTGPSEVAFAACVLFTAAGELIRLFAVTPGAIGIREFVIGGLAYLVGFSARDAVIASTLIRLVEVAVIFSLGAFFTFALSSRMAGGGKE